MVFDPIELVNITAIALGLITGLFALESLAFIRAGTFSNFSKWELQRLRFRFTAGKYGDVLSHIMDDKRISRLMMMRMLSGIILIALALYHTSLWSGLLLVCIINWAVILRSPHGTDGADQMLNLICSALLVGELGGTEVTKSFALLFIAAQSVLSYWVSGFAKLMSQSWRTGKGLEGVFNTRLYGHRILADLFSLRKGSAKVISWFIIIVQLASPIFLFFGMPGAFTFILVYTRTP